MESFNQTRTIRTEPIKADKPFGIVELDDEANFFEWLECENCHLEWQHNSGNDVNNCINSASDVKTSEVIVNLQLIRE